MIFLLFPSDADGTSIVAILSNNTVVIAADSKQTTVGIPGAKPVSGCKLHVVNNLAWSTSGLDHAFTVDPRNGSTKTVYDMNHFIGGVAVTKDSPQAKIARLDSLIPSAILSEAKTLQRTSPQGFAFFSGGRVFLEVLLVGFENGKVVISHREYGLEVSKGKVTVGQNRWKPDCPGEGCRNPQAFFTGERGALEKFFMSHPDVFRSTSINYLRDVAIRSVQMEIDAAPEIVGGPIETATIDGSGVHWEENNTVCPDGKQPSKPSPKPQKSARGKTQ